MCGLKISVSGEQLTVTPESVKAWVAVVLMVVPLKPMVNNAGNEPPPVSEPHTYRSGVPVPPK